MNSRNSLDEMRKMREAAIKRAKATQAKSQGELSFSHLESNNKAEEKMSDKKGINSSRNNDNGKNIENSEFNSSAVPIIFKGNKNNKPSFDNITNILKDILQDTDKTLILVLILLLMDNEENFPILLVLFYLLL